MRVRRDGRVVGAGFLVAADLVVTCAHVLGEPDGAVSLDFPLLPGRPEAVGRVVRWWPVAEDGRGDVAVVRVVPPDGAAPVPGAADVDVWGHRLRVLGFPNGFDDGRWLTGTLLGRQGTGWVQVEVDGVVRRGYSGAPVWDEDAGGVVGMLVAGTREGTAFLIPGSDLGPEWARAAPEPYRGLVPFQEQDEALFHGRGGDVARLVEHVAHRGFALVAGPSGSGKSSLVRAGLVPVSRRAGTAISVVRHAPGTSALGTFADLVAGLGGERRVVRESLRDAEDVALLAADVVREHGRALLFVDQFEEVVAQDPDLARELVGLLLALRRAADGVAVVLTIRSDSLDDLVTPESAAALERAFLLVAPPDADGLRAAVTEPVKAVGGVAFEAGLVDRVLADAGREPGRLPLVEFALTELWRRRSGGVLTHRAYGEIGEVSGALTDYADRTLWAHVADKDAARRLLTRLVRAEDLTRRSLPLAEVTDREVLAVLAATRLVVVGDGRVELAHQALIDRWERLRGWLHEDREFLAWRDELDQRRAQWEASGRDPGSLLGGVALTRALEWRATRPVELSTVDVEFIRAGVRRRRRSGWRRTVLVIGALVLVIAVTALGLVIREQNRSVDAERIADESARLLSEKPVEAARLAVRAWRTDPANARAFGALIGARLAFTSVERAVPNGKRRLAGSHDGAVIAERENEDEIVVRTAGDEWRIAHRGGELALSPDGATLASVSGGDVDVWNVRTRSGPTRLEHTGHDRIQQLRFDLTATTLTGKGIRGRTEVNPVAWSVVTGQPVRLGTFEKDLRFDYMTPLGTDRLLVDKLHEVVEQDRTTGTTLRSFGAESVLLGNGDAVASCVQGAVRIVHVGTGQEDLPGLPCTQDWFITDGSGEFLSVGSADDLTTPSIGTGKYLHWRSGKTFTTRAPEFASEAVLTSSGEMVAVSTARVDVPQLHLRARPDVGYQVAADGRERAFHPDHRTWATVSAGQVLLVDAASGELRRRIALPADVRIAYRSVTFTSNGRWLVAMDDHRLLVHRADTLEPVRTIEFADRFDRLTPRSAALGGDEVAVVVRNRLRSWRVDTGEPVGDGIELIDPLDLSESSLSLRPGTDRQVVVTSPYSWWLVDLDTGRVAQHPWSTDNRLISPPAPVTDATGALVVMDVGKHGVGVFDVDSGAVRWKVTEISPMSGGIAGPHGDVLVIQTLEDLQVWRRDTRVTTIPDLPRTWGATVLDGRLRMLVPGVEGRGDAEVSLPLDPAALAEELCGIHGDAWTECHGD